MDDVELFYEPSGWPTLTFRERIKVLFRRDRSKVELKNAKENS